MAAAAEFSSNGCDGSCFVQSCCTCTFHKHGDPSCPTGAADCFCEALDELDPGQRCPHDCKCECTCDHRFHEEPCDPRCSARVGRTCTAGCVPGACIVNKYAPEMCGESKVPNWVLFANEGSCPDCASVLGPCNIKEAIEDQTCLVCFTQSKAGETLDCGHHVCAPCIIRVRCLGRDLVCPLCRTSS